MVPAIQARSLRKVYTVGFTRTRRVVALDGLDLSIEPGQVFGLLGPNGAGKSTTIKIILDLLRATSGEVKVFGKDPSRTETRRLLGYLPENPAPYEYLSGREFVTFVAQLTGLGEREAAGKADEVIERVGMTHARHLHIRRYSKGMIQRISLAQALLGAPRLLVLDEPTSGLDVLGRRLVKEIILDERRRGTTIVFCSHIIADVEELCDTVAVLIGGRLYRQGTVSELIASNDTVMELAVDGATRDTFAPVLDLVSDVQLVGNRLILRFEEKHHHAVLGTAVAARARIISLDRSRSSLESVFVQAVSGAERKVGSEIS